MSSMKMVPISHEEYLSGKWQSVSSSSGKHEAKVFYKDDGSIDECSYTDSYCRKHQLGRYAPKAESSSKSSSSKSSSGKSGSKIAPIPFSSKSSKRKPNFFDEDYEEEDNDNEKEPEMENEIRVRAEIEDSRKREFIRKIERYVDGGEDITTEMIEEVRSLAIENGYSPTEAEITLKNAQRKQDPERVYADSYQGRFSRTFRDFLKDYPVPRNREYLIKYINMILITNDGIDDMSDETLDNIKKVVNLKFRNDSEIQALFKELSAKKRKKERLFLAIPIIAMIIMLIMAIILNA